MSRAQNSPKIRVCFVCLGNICRSPLAEGAFRAQVAQAGLVEAFEIDSAGTAAYHAGEAPDPRSVKVAQRHGVNIAGQRARKLVRADLDHFDVVMAMDASNLRNIRPLGAGAAEVGMLLAEADLGGGDVPDPYYGGPGGFDHVWSLVNDGAAALLTRLCEEHGLRRG